MAEYGAECDHVAHDLDPADLVHDLGERYGDEAEVVAAAEIEVGSRDVLGVEDDRGRPR